MSERPPEKLLFPQEEKVVKWMPIVVPLFALLIVIAVFLIDAEVL